MLVSVIITTYRRKPGIVIRALRSVMKQTFSDIEIIVVDDSPIDFEKRDAVQQAVLNTCKTVKYISTGGSKGAPVARDYGIHEATGKYIAFLDDDDEWLPEKIEKQLEGFKSDEIGLVYSGMIIRNEIDSTAQICKCKCYSGKVFDTLLQDGNFIGSTSVPLIRKKCLESVGGFDESLEACQDYDLYIRIARQYRVSFVDGNYTIYHVHKGDRISTDARAKLHGEISIIKKYSDEIARIPQAKIRLYRHMIICYCSLRKRKRSLKIWISTIKLKPLDLSGNLKFFLFAIFPQDSFFIKWSTSLKHMIKNSLIIL